MAYLTSCHDACLSAAMTRMVESPPNQGPQHLRLMMDCASACLFAAEALARKSQFHSPICALCAEICSSATQALEKLQGFDDCKEACLRAAGSARELARLDHAEILAMAAKLPPNG
jgi:hypothetical protein